MPRASIYIVLCRDRSYYTGITRRDVDERVSEHNQGIDPDCYTFLRRPVRLVFSTHFERIDEAVATERRIKGWSRAKKEALIHGDLEILPELAARRTSSRSRAPSPFETRPSAAPQGEGTDEPP
ncbi:MAG: GIY-YIG nuclease family protein [Methylocystis sp.]|nr:GIY-YIG nuclease family protein [Methylocystis sp.]